MQVDDVLKTLRLRKLLLRALFKMLVGGSELLGFLRT